LFNYEFKLYVALIFQVTCSIINILWFWSSSCCSPSWKSPVLWISLNSAAKWMSNWSFGWISFSSCSIGRWWSGTSLCQLYLLIVCILFLSACCIYIWLWTNGYLVFYFLCYLIIWWMFSWFLRNSLHSVRDASMKCIVELHALWGCIEHGISLSE